jgi:hypothetical protein
MLAVVAIAAKNGASLGSLPYMLDSPLQKAQTMRKGLLREMLSLSM